MSEERSPSKAEFFVGKTIESVDASSSGCWIFHMTDGTSVEIFGYDYEEGSGSLDGGLGKLSAVESRLDEGTKSICMDHLSILEESYAIESDLFGLGYDICAQEIATWSSDERSSIRKFIALMSEAISEKEVSEAWDTPVNDHQNAWDFIDRHCG